MAGFCEWLRLIEEFLETARQKGAVMQFTRANGSLGTGLFALLCQNLAVLGGVWAGGRGKMAKYLPGKQHLAGVDSGQKGRLDSGGVFPPQSAPHPGSIP